MSASTDSSLLRSGAAWLDALRRRGHSHKTVATYAAAVVNLRRFLNRRQIVDARRIKQSDLEAWQQTLGKCPPATIRPRHDDN
jgi:site-specific recombinase XerD